MQLNNILNNVTKALKSNSPEILTALGVSGVFTTAYLSSKAGYHAAHKLENEAPDLPIKEKAKIVWKLYIPPAVSGVLSVGCILGASKTNGRRTAAAVTAYSITERAFTEYKEKVVEELGKGKEQKIRDELAQKKVSDNPPKEILIAGGGSVLCCELYTHRYFRSDMESLRKAQNDINSMIINQFYVTLDDLYDLLNLPTTTMSGSMGWDSDKLLEFEFSAIIADNGEPCIAFNYNYISPIR